MICGKQKHRRGSQEKISRHGDENQLVTISQRSQEQKTELERLRLENLELKEAMPHKITKEVHAERVEKERLLAENEVLVDGHMHAQRQRDQT
jgi:dynactin complex subunit